MKAIATTATKPTTLHKILLSTAFVIALLMLLPTMAFATSEFKGTETVNINRADAATLAAYLKGIGPSKADAIVKYRRANGNFKTIADIQNVPGIGEETFKDMKRNISTSRGKSVAPNGYKLGAVNSNSSTVKKKRKTVKKKLNSPTTASQRTATTSTSTKKRTLNVIKPKKKTTKKTLKPISRTTKKTTKRTTKRKAVTN